MKLFKNKFLYLILAGIGLDQLSKFWANHALSFFTPLIIIPQRLSLQLVHNYGAAYGILQHQRLFLLLISCLVIICCIVFWQKFATNSFTKFGMSFLLIGAVGNFLDRLYLGYVVDFVDMKIFPVFNLADVCIDLAIVCFLLDLVFNLDTSVKKQG